MSILDKKHSKPKKYAKKVHYFIKLLGQTQKIRICIKDDLKI